MGQQANIVAFDGAATPVTHTFIPDGFERESDGTTLAKWKESLATVPDYAQIRVLQRKRKLPSGVFRVSNRVEVPVMESVSGQNSAGYTAPPKVAHVATADLAGYFHERSINADRRNATQLCLNISGGVTTSVTPVTTGSVPELFQQLIIVS